MTNMLFGRGMFSWHEQNLKVINTMANKTNTMIRTKNLPSIYLYKLKFTLYNAYIT